MLLTIDFTIYCCKLIQPKANKRANPPFQGGGVSKLLTEHICNKDMNPTLQTYRAGIKLTGHRLTYKFLLMQGNWEKRKISIQPRFLKTQRSLIQCLHLFS
jgi:hypothetical protein